MYSKLFKAFGSTTISKVKSINFLGTTNNNEILDKNSNFPILFAGIMSTFAIAVLYLSGQFESAIDIIKTFVGAFGSWLLHIIMVILVFLSFFLTHFD